MLLRFADGLDRFLRSAGSILDLTSYRLHGNVKRQDDDTALLDVEVTALLDEFRAELDSLAAVEGAQEALAATGTAAADVVVLSNVDRGPGAGAAAQPRGTRLRFSAAGEFRPQGPGGEGAGQARRAARPSSSTTSRTTIDSVAEARRRRCCAST